MTTSQPNRQDRRKAAKKNESGSVPLEGASSAADFKKKKLFDELVRLPSGNRVKMRKPGMIEFLESGFLPDPLAQLIRKQISDRTGKVTDADLMKSLVAGDDLELIKEMMRATDRIAAFCIYEPTVVWHEREKVSTPDEKTVAYEDIPDSERDPEIVYTDEMELEDKMFVFQAAVGGSTDLTRFRQATSSSVGALSTG